MVFIEVVQALLILAILAIAIFQVFIPLYKETPLFPLFRKKRRELEKELVEEKQVSVEDELKKEISQEHQKHKRSHK